MCKQTVFEFQDHNRHKVTASFDGGYLSSDGGGSLLLRELELRTGIIGRLAGCFTDHRNKQLIEHSVEALLRQRIGALSLGYEDLNDHDNLRHDPTMALMGQAKKMFRGWIGTVSVTRPRRWLPTAR